MEPHSQQIHPKHAGTPSDAVTHRLVPTCNAGEADYPSLSMSSHAPEPPRDGAARARVFQGGTYLDLHKMLAVTSGSQVLPSPSAGALLS